MQHRFRLARASFLALSMLSACAAADPFSGSPATAARSAPSGVYGEFLAGRFAAAHAAPDIAADSFLRALATRADDSELLRHAFTASLMAGRAEAIQLARQLPDDPVAQLLLADQDLRAGNWQAAEQRYRALPSQGLTQVLQPLLLAWTQAGAGQTDAALGTLQPFVNSQRFRGVFALHAAMIADLGGKQEAAAKLYATAEAEMPPVNLRVGEILASWQIRSGQPVAAQRTLATLAANAPEMSIALPSLLAAGKNRPVNGAADGIAEAYLEFAAAMRSQDSADHGMLMLRLALDLRPGFTAARLMAAENLAADHTDAALQMLAAIPSEDPLSPVVRLRRATLIQQLGRTDEAMHELDRLAAANPGSPLPILAEGDILRSQQHFAAAIAAYSRAIDLVRQPGPNDWPVFYYRGIAYDRMREWDKAEADFRRALTLSPDQPAVLNYLGYTWADKGERLAEARQMIQKASEHRPNDGAITDSLGWVMLRQGDVAAAVKTLERAVEQEPEDATLNAHLGDAYWAAGRHLEAQYQWRRALTLNPAPEELAKLEAKLQTPAGTVMSGQ